MSTKATFFINYIAGKIHDEDEGKVQDETALFPTT